MVPPDQGWGHWQDLGVSSLSSYVHIRIKESILGLSISFFRKRCVQPLFFFFFGNSLIQTVHPTLWCKNTAGKTAAEAGSDLGLPLAWYQRAPQRMVGETLTKWKLLWLPTAGWASSFACEEIISFHSGTRLLCYVSDSSFTVCR